MKSKNQIRFEDVPSVLLQVYNELKSVKREILEIKESFNHEFDHDELLTRQEVADIFKCDPSTIHNWTVSGRLVKYGQGSRTYYKRSEILSSLIPLKS